MLFNNSLIKSSVLGLIFSFSLSTAQAEIIIHGTRVIYASDAREVTVQLSNNGEKASLVQSWIDRGDASATPEKSEVPFIISPPITRVEAEKGQALRITALPTVTSLNQSQETLFWLNVLDIPPKPSTSMDVKDNTPENYLQLAIRSRIKLFYRPSSIQGSVSEASAKMRWQIQGDEIIANNPTPYYLTLTSIEQKNSEKAVNIIENGLLLEPFSKQSIKLKSKQLSNMKYTIINDYGSRVERDISL